MTKKKTVKVPPPFVKNIKTDISKIISIVKGMGFKFTKHEEDNLIVIQCERELQIVIEDNKIFLTMDSLLCPKKVFDLSLSLFQNNIDIYSTAIVHQLPNGELLTGEEACDGRHSLFDFIDSVLTMTEKDDLLNSISEKTTIH
jgi:hypothetical protein